MPRLVYLTRLGGASEETQVGKDFRKVLSMFSVLRKAEGTSLKNPGMGTRQHQGLTIPYCSFQFSFASHNLPCHL